MVSLRKGVIAIAVIAASLVVAVPAMADTTITYRMTSVEPFGGPVQSPFTCAAGTSCGSVTLSGIGHATDNVIVFNACGFGCHIRTITFDDGSTLVIREEVVGVQSPGNSDRQGYGNPTFIQITQAIVGGTGRFAGATGTGAGTVTVAGGAGIVKASGTITLS